MTRKEQFMELYGPNHARFERFCKARVYGEMDFKDLMHDTVVIAFQKFDPGYPGSFLSFLFGIAIRVLANNKRRLDKSNTHLATCITVEDQSEKRHEIEHLYTALNMLPEMQKETIILFEIIGYSIKEISALHGAGESAVKQRLIRGRARLKEMLTLPVEQQKH
jgi:RNA polymerase sigma factor (sigma-70 family)